MTITNLTPSQLRKAADLKERIEKLQQELNELQGAEAETAAPAKAAKVGGRKFSAAGLAAIRAAQKARWAKVHAGQPAKAAVKAAVKAPGKRGPRKMSDAARAKIAAAQKARWAKFHANK